MMELLKLFGCVYQCHNGHASLFQLYRYFGPAKIPCIANSKFVFIASLKLQPYSYVTGVGGWAWSRVSGGKEAPTGGAAALTALNPSTDPLVAAQYAPVRDAPPAPDDEMRNLMDNKEW